MPIQTDLSVSPYFDDFSDDKDYYKILFRPGVSVQARELNQLQTILQRQIERFGDNVLKKGTIVDGCDITFNDNYQFVKINDNTTSGEAINLDDFVGYYVRNSANISPLVASIQTMINGFESRTPDLKTLYLRYLNTGYSNVAGVETAQTNFGAAQTLTVYNPDNIIEKVDIINASAGFSNTDVVIFTSAIAVQNTVGGTKFANGTNFASVFAAGATVTSGDATATVVSVNATANTQAVILRILPTSADLVTANTAEWTFNVGDNITVSSSPLETVNCTSIVGSGAVATLTTDSVGAVSTINMTSGGSGYYVLPTTTIMSTGATTTQITNVNLNPQNFIAQITSADAAANGSGYAMTVGSGVVYQKGHFSRVNEHLVVVEKYANTGFDAAVGFDTTEEIINSSQDTSLLDNATGESNETAPGANRLKLTPKLVVRQKEEAQSNNDFLSVVEFSNGIPYKQSRETVYNVLGRELARRTFEESGDYVLDQFLLNTKAANTIVNEETSFNIVIDPGVAYINGARVQTVATYEAAVDKGIDTFVAENVNISMNYGSYIRINELGGVFQFNTGDQISLYGIADDYISGGSAGTTPSAGTLGTELGKARIRSLVYESGVPGAADATYRLYLFDIRMAVGKNFADVKSVFYDGTNKGVADTILENGLTVLKDANLSALLYYAGRPAVKAGNNFSYIYRTISQDRTLASNGIITIGTGLTEVFPYTQSAALSTAQEGDIIITPLANVEASANVAGSVSCNATSTQVNGTSTTFTSVFEAGDFIKIANSSSSIIRQVSRVVNNTVLVLTTNATAFTGANTNIFFPANMPISIQRSTRTANVDSNANTLTIDIGTAVNVATTIAVAYNVRAVNATPVTKTVNRDKFVRLQLSNNEASNTGPWALGVPDVFRLGKVYKGPNATFTDSDTVNVVDVTSDYYIDHNQAENFYGISYLYPRSTQAVANTTDFLLVKFDHFTSSGEGMKAPGDGITYQINDGLDLPSSTSSINTLEIPEVYGAKGEQYDLRDQFDFRPLSANTVAPTATANTAPINPTEPADAGRFSATDKKFPAPDSTLTGRLEYYLGRVDRVIVDENANFRVIKGTPDTLQAPAEPDNTLTINFLNIPPYPSQPRRLSAQTAVLADTGIANEKYSTVRLNTYTVNVPLDQNNRQFTQPRGYTMTDIGSLERRIKDLEYYVSFTIAETQASSKVIPSSANSSIDRFKFGFFVDSFNSYSYSDVNNPQYKASIVDGYLSPKAEEINLPVSPPDPSGCIRNNYIEVPFIVQRQATDGPITPVANTTPSSNTATGTITIAPVVNTTPTVVQTTTNVVQANKTLAKDNNGTVYEEFFYRFSDEAGPVELYMVARDNNMAAEIFQSSTGSDGPWVSIETSATATFITTSDITSKALNTLGSNIVIEHPGSLDRKGFGPVGNFIEDQFKLLWTHDPSSGVYYKIRIYKGGNSGAQGKPGTFVYKLYYPTDTTVNSTSTTSGGTSTVNYDVNFYGIVSGTGYSSTSYLSDSYSFYTVPKTVTETAYVSEQAFNIRITGLKPLTGHLFFFENVDRTARCQQAGKVLGAGLRTDTNGAIDFTFYYYADMEATSTTSATAAAAAMEAGIKSIRLVNSDNTSTATSTIQIPTYLKETTTYVADPVLAEQFVLAMGGKV